MSTFYYLFQSFRLKDWIGNLFVFIPLILAGLIFDYGFFLKAAEAFFLFGLAAGAISILNDVLDIEKDKKHPEKSKRPIASGKLNSGIALFVSLALIVLGLWLALKVNLRFTILFSSFIILDLVYSLWLEKVRFVNSVFVALTYVLRVYAGGAIINLSLNVWYFICSFLFGLFHFFYKKKKEHQ
jgi:4-hydroxybenzoate polyprenyltransferase